MPRVLIIDDELGIRFALQRWFTRLGWLVLEAGDGEIGLAQLRESSDEDSSRIDLVLCDLHLPTLSGDALHALLRVERPAILARMILCTGDAVAAAPVGSVIASHPYVLQKPFELSELRTLVQRIVPTHSEPS